ncbi:LGFP repeat-containing protein [Corynebacterium axilliensis]|uniref:LGFP repeat-containing protein n=1 Tax=Corynebacterium sp. YSMAA5_1_F9 TaxID=3383591 RepID=UPI0038CFB833
MKALSRKLLAFASASLLISVGPGTAIAQSFSGLPASDDAQTAMEESESLNSANDFDSTVDGGETTQQTVDRPFAQWGIATPPGAEGYEVNQATTEELNPQGLNEWHPTPNPNKEIIPGQMRSDREEIPADVDKSEADKAEIREAQLADPDTPTLNARPGCGVYWPLEFEVCGLIKEKYDSIGGPKSFLNLPKSNELTNPDGVGKRSEFVNGYIYWHPKTGAHTVSLPVSLVWERHGWEKGFLGYPTTSDIPQGNAWYKQDFQGGHVYTHNFLPPSQASIQGAIYDKWQSMGAQNSELGYPISDELTTPDGIGRYNVFEHGMIYWTPQHGAHPVSGTFLVQYAEKGFEKGPLGYPTGDPVAQDSFWKEQAFVGGKLTGVTKISKDLYWPISGPPIDSPVLQKSDSEKDEVAAENYASRVLPCISYELSSSTNLAAWRVPGKGVVLLDCGRFRTHMVPNPEATGKAGHFKNYPPTRKEWYDFLGCASYTFQAEDFDRAHSGNWGRQRGNTYSGVSSVMIARNETNAFVTGWAGKDEYSAEWAGCVKNLPLSWQ